MKQFTAPLLVSILVLSGCTHTTAAQKAWTQRVVGVVAQLNDVVVLQIVPEIAKTQPDLATLTKACDELETRADIFEAAATNPPKSYIHTAPQVSEIADLLDALSSRCGTSSGVGGYAAWKTVVGATLANLATLESTISDELPKNVGCDSTSQRASTTCKTKSP